MSQVIGQLNISERQMLMNTPPKVSDWTEIGTAEITHTIFGRAKVRIIRKHGKVNSSLLLMTLAAIAVVAWLGWFVFQRTGSSYSKDSSAHINTNGEEATAASQTDNISASATLPPRKSKTIMPSQTMDSHKNESQQHVLKNVVQKAAMPLRSNLSPNSKVVAVALPRTTQTAASSPAAVTSLSKIESAPPSSVEGH
jgi:hypothetical protein